MDHLHIVDDQLQNLVCQRGQVSIGRHPVDLVIPTNVGLSPHLGVSLALPVSLLHGHRCPPHCVELNACMSIRRHSTVVIRLTPDVVKAPTEEFG